MSIPRIARPFWISTSALLIACAKVPEGAAARLPDTPPGIGFDDLRYSMSMHRVLVPSGRTGRLNLIDPDTLEVTSISGFSAKRAAPAST